MSEYSLADLIFDNMEAEGFHCVGHKGLPGEEVVTFQNEAGEKRVVKFGTTPVQPKNYKLKLNNPDTSDTAPQVQEMHTATPKVICKFDFSNLNKEGGENGRMC